VPRRDSTGVRWQGSRGLWTQDRGWIQGGGATEPEAWEKDGPWLEKHAHPLWKAYESFGPRGGHDGLDYLTLRGFVESVQSGTEPPIDVYDAASWMAITCLSEQSVSLGGAAVPIPDFTDGKWILRGRGHKSPYSLDDVHYDLY